MISIFLHCAPGDEDLVTAELWEEDTEGIADEPGGLRAFFANDARAPELLLRFHRLKPRLRVEAATDWEQVSREAWPAMLVGERFFLVPPWRDDPAPAGRLRLEIYPGMACGTGRHPATQLCLEAMERYVRPGMTVLDIGTGSGILSSAALLLGARVIGCDIDGEAVEIARRRVGVPFFTGSLDAVRSNYADVIVANIDSGTIEALRDEFQRVRRVARSTLILSGFPQWDEVEDFEVTETLRRDDWVCLVSSLP